MFIQCDSITVNPNPGEVKDYKFVTIEELLEIIEKAKQGTIKISPWFGLIFDNFLLPWWKTLKSNPADLTTDQAIHKVN